MYVVLWACMENAGVDAVKWIHTAGLDEMLGVDVGEWSPTLINGLVAIEINYLLEFARMPVVLFLLKKRNAGSSDASRSGQSVDVDGATVDGVLDKRHREDIGDKFKP
jgi:hypothetical protein